MNLVWLRNDLRLEDNPALYHASTQGPICCVYIVSEGQWQSHDDAAAKIQFWRTRLLALADELSTKNIPLKVIQQDHFEQVPAVLFQLATTISAKAIYFNHEYALNEKQRDLKVQQHCQQANISVQAFHGDVVMPPGSVKTQSDTYYHVYSPFARQWRKQVCLPSHTDKLTVLPTPRKQAKTTICSDDIEQSWPAGQPTGFREDLWPTHSKAIHQRLQRFANNSIEHYKEIRDIPSIAGTSTLSPYLACGAISVRQCINAARQYSPNWLENAWVNELIWREFYRHLLDTYPHLSRSEDFKASPKPIPWSHDEQQWQAWCRGETGYPIVDAAIKQLLQTGWMHNRLRMVVAAFLTKLLLIDWRKGEAFFMQHLLDGDYASNNGGWQWAASTGADAAPYFRIFNPERQSQRFDPEGKFIKKFLPELAELDHKSIHTPTSEQRRACGYPEPIIDYKFARQRALDGYATAMGKHTKQAAT